MHRDDGIGGGFLIAAGISATLVMSSSALAQWEPSEQITLVSQSSPGTGNDLILRELNAILTKTSIVPVSIANETKGSIIQSDGPFGDSSSIVDRVISDKAEWKDYVAKNALVSA